MDDEWTRRDQTMPPFPITARRRPSGEPIRVRKVTSVDSRHGYAALFERTTLHGPPGLRAGGEAGPTMG